MNTSPIVFALDVGDARVGVAKSDALGISAHPLCTLERKGNHFEALAALLR
ncbi:MAG: RuvX/YqgF family protein, partial [Bdellovibrionales bacterium]|nr:RuvX/YqgF family protein [Bdellovibrionales bacterium]